MGHLLIRETATMNDDRVYISKLIERQEAEISKLSGRLERIKGCSLNRVVEFLERAIARAQIHRLVLIGMLRQLDHNHFFRG
jgi:hypothetical protein